MFFIFLIPCWNSLPAKTRMRAMDTHALLAFIAVAETGSFSLAAERLNLTQPAVSKRVAALERHLGARLFDRIARTEEVKTARSTLTIASFSSSARASGPGWTTRTFKASSTRAPIRALNWRSASWTPKRRTRR